MTEQEVIKILENNCFSGDAEIDHSNADDILCDFLLSLGYKDLVERYNEVDKWYS